MDFPSTTAKPHRFEVLDSWRGICACLIVFFHFNDEVFSHFQDFPIIRYAYIFVDFFFVLSGFVICASYENKLLKGMPIKDYAFLRIGRVYPLHLFMLLMYVLFECSKFFVQTRVAPFSDPSSNLEAIITNLFLIQSLGILDHFTLNQPAWSISVEFYTYILYALALGIFRKHIWILSLFIVLFAPFLMLQMGVDRMDVAYDYGFIRCIYGFSGGILAYKFYKYVAGFNLFFPKVLTILEFITFIIVFLYVVQCGGNVFSLWAPYIFMICILIFSLQQGWLSHFLAWKPFVFIGGLSYAIYMVHTFTQLILYNIAKIADKIFTLGVFKAPPPGIDYETLAVEKWHGDLIQIGGFGVVIIVALLAHYLIEMPSNRWCRRYIQRKHHQNVPEASSAAF